MPSGRKPGEFPKLQDTNEFSREISDNSVATINDNNSYK